jgi:predicted XRE-type DNA-binding protein
LGRPRIDVTRGSGNVFADLALSDSDELLAKAALVHEIASAIDQLALTQTEAARVLGTTQPNVSALLAGRLGGFSMERLIRFLNALDRDVAITVSTRQSRHQRATLSVQRAGP